MANEVVRALAELQRRVDYLERPKTATPTAPIVGTVTKTISDVRAVSAVADQALFDANHITETQITEGAIKSPHIAANAIDGHVITGATIRTSAVNPRLELTGTSFAGYGPTGAAWMSLDESGLRTNYPSGSMSQYLWTGEGTTNSGLWTYRQDGTLSSRISGEHIETYHADGVQRAISMGDSADGLSAGIWVYRADGVETSQITRNGIFTKRPDGTVAARINHERIALDYTELNPAVDIATSGLTTFDSSGTKRLTATSAGYVNTFDADGWSSCVIGGGIIRSYYPGGYEATSVYRNGVRIRQNPADGSNVERMSLHPGRGIEMSRSDGTASVTINDLGVRTYYSDGSTPSVIVGTNVAGDSSIWTYRGDGTPATQMDTNLFRMNNWAGDEYQIQLQTNNPYPQQRIFARDALGLIADGYTGVVVRGDQVLFQNYMYTTAIRSTTFPANMHWSSGDNQIYQVSSMGVNKLDQEPITLDVAEKVLELSPKTWRDRGDVSDNPGTDRRAPGLIAEEVLAVSQANGDVLQPLIAESRSDGTAIIGINYDRLAAYLIPLIRDLRDRVTALETP